MSVEATESQRRRVPKRFVETGAWVHSLWNRGEEVVREGGALEQFLRNFVGSSCLPRAWCVFTCSGGALTKPVAWCPTVPEPLLGLGQPV